MTLFTISSDGLLFGVQLSLMVSALLCSSFILYPLLKRKRCGLSPAAGITLALISFIALSAFTLRYHFAPFYSASMDSYGLTLSRAEPFGSQRLLWRDIATVKFGSSSRGGRHCYITVYTHDEHRYRSANLPHAIDFCKTLRAQLLQAIEQQL